MKGGDRSDPGLMKRLIESVSMKTSQLRNRLMIFVLLHRDESLLMDGMHAVLGGPRHRRLVSSADDDVDHREDIVGEGADNNFVVYMNRESATVTQPSSPPPHQVFAYTQEDSERRNYRDLTQTLPKDSEEEMELTDNELDSLDIDHAADVFIARFKRQMR